MYKSERDCCRAIARLLIEGGSSTVAQWHYEELIATFVKRRYKRTVTVQIEKFVVTPMVKHEGTLRLPSISMHCVKLYHREHWLIASIYPRHKQVQAAQDAGSIAHDILERLEKYEGTILSIILNEEG